MKKITFILSFLVLSAGVFAQTAWTLDPYHSKLGFSITHLGIADVSGHFGKFDVTVKAAKPDFSDAVVEMTTDINSINTSVDARDNHLRSADFFEVEKYPTMYFKSTSIKKIAENKYSLTGNLTLRGITKPLTVNMIYRGTIANPNAKGAPAAGIQITGTIDRSEFNVGSGFPAPMLSNEVLIKADGEFAQK